MIVRNVVLLLLICLLPNKLLIFHHVLTTISFSDDEIEFFTSPVEVKGFVRNMDTDIQPPYNICLTSDPMQLMLLLQLLVIMILFVSFSTKIRNSVIAFNSKIVNHWHQQPEYNVGVLHLEILFSWRLMVSIFYIWTILCVSYSRCVKMRKQLFPVNVLLWILFHYTLN